MKMLMFAFRKRTTACSIAATKQTWTLKVLLIFLCLSEVVQSVVVLLTLLQIVFPVPANSSNMTMWSFVATCSGAFFRLFDNAKVLESYPATSSLGLIACSIAWELSGSLA